jgi:hypothetical protein
MRWIANYILILFILLRPILSDAVEIAKNRILVILTAFGIIGGGEQLS